MGESLLFMVNMQVIMLGACARTHVCFAIPVLGPCHVAHAGTDDQHKKQQQNAKQQSGSPSGQAAKRQKTDDDPPSQCL